MQTMGNALEYLFYHKEFCEQFTNYLAENNLPWSMSREPIQDALVVLLKEEDIVSRWDDVDDFYDQLAEQEAEYLEQAAMDDNVSTAGIHIQLANGGNTIAKVNPRVLKRILAVIDHDEFGGESLWPGGCCCCHGNKPRCGHD